MPKRAAQRPKPKPKAKPRAARAAKRPAALKRPAAKTRRKATPRPQRSWFQRWAPTWPWSRMAFLPHHMRLLACAESKNPGAEALRLALSYAGLSYEERRLSPEECQQMLLRGELPPLPVLVVDGQFQLSQVNAILRYVAKLSHGSCGLYPEDPEPWMGTLGRLPASRSGLWRRDPPLVRSGDCLHLLYLISRVGRIESLNRALAAGW
ncbi:unnamed protein product [Effrenium voratum]|nr:unnamed protein product [Effrenium voratum]